MKRNWDVSLKTKIFKGSGGWYIVSKDFVAFDQCFGWAMMYPFPTRAHARRVRRDIQHFGYYGHI